MASTKIRTPNFLQFDEAADRRRIPKQVLYRRKSLRACWTRGHAPTYHEFAQLWLKARADHTKPNPEWAFLTDRANGVAGADWKSIRIQKASTALTLLKKATSSVFVPNELESWRGGVDFYRDAARIRCRWP